MMVDHDKNLETVIEARKVLVNELRELQSASEQKREMFIKYSGIIEYLSSIKQAEESKEEQAESLAEEE